MSTEKTNIWSGFWRRLGAWLIDNIVLAIVCYGFGWAATDMVAAWGQNGRAFGLVLGILYFGITASGVAGGRSIGMRALGLKVVDFKGRPLGLLAAVGRAILLVAPLMLNGWSFKLPPQIPADIVNVIIIVAVLGILPAQCYLLLFNGPTRRMLHDIVFGAVVVRADADKPDMPKGKVHAVVAGLIVLAVAGLAVAAPYLLKRFMPASVTNVLSPLQKVIDAVNALPEVADTDAQDNTNTFYQTGKPPQVTRTLIVTARMRKWPVDNTKEVARVGAVAVKTYAFAPGQQLTVRLVYGFDLGFGSYNNSYSSPVSPSCTADTDCSVK